MGNPVGHHWAINHNRKSKTCIYLSIFSRRNLPRFIDQSHELERKLQLVLHTGLVLSKRNNFESIAQSAADAGLQLCGAQVGAFLYRVTNHTDEKYLYALSGINCEALSEFSSPHNTTVVPSAFEGTGVIRSPDITKDLRYGKDAPFLGVFKDRIALHSYLAIHVKGPDGQIIGGLFYGHEDVDVFEESEEDFIAAVAAQAALAIENVRLRAQLTDKINHVQRIERDQKESSKGLGELAAIVQSSDDAIISKDLNGMITSWNEAASRILGYSSEEMVGQPILKLIPPHLHSDETVILAKIRAGERIEHFETV